MLIKIKNWFKKTPIDQQMRGMSWITETLPMYHDRARSTNKTIWTIKKMMTDEVAEACRLGSSRLEHKDIADMVMLSQNGNPIRFKPNGKLLSHEPFFEKEGYKVGQIYSFERLGFLGEQIVSPKYHYPASCSQRNHPLFFPILFWFHNPFLIGI